MSSPYPTEQDLDQSRRVNLDAKLWKRLQSLATHPDHGAPDSAPDVSWAFCIGGYQPAQKWLKDRKGRALGFENVKHYQRILKSLTETDRIMRTITMTLNYHVISGR